MKKYIILLFLVVGIVRLSFSQNQRAVKPSPQQTSRNISWQKVVQEDVPGTGKQSIMTFENAQYDLLNHLFPIYTECIKMTPGASKAEAVVFDETYVALSDEEKIAISKYGPNNKSRVKADVAPSVTISLHKKIPYAYVQFVPIRKNNVTGEYEKLISFSMHVNPVSFSQNKYNRSTLKTYAANSVLATGKWYKISVTADGVYKMDYAFLKKMGLDLATLNPKDIRVYGNGGGQLPFANAGFRHDDLQENAITVVGENDGKFDSTDYALFYGEGQHRWKYNSTDKKFHHYLNIYSDTTYYFITTDLGVGKRIAPQSSSATTPTNTVTSFDDFQFHEAEGVNLLKSGREWLGETFDILTSYNFTFDFPNIETVSPVCALVVVAARADTPGTNFTWTAGSSSSSFNISGVNTSDIYGSFYVMKTDTQCFLPGSGTVLVAVTKTTPTPSLGWLNYIEVNARRTLMMAGNEMNFRDMASVNSGNVSQYLISNAIPTQQVWDVTDPVNVKNQQGNFSSGTFDFTLPSDSLREFISFNGQSFLTASLVGPVQNQDLHSLPQSDLLIVTNPLFLQAANTLADLHRTQDNLTVSVATTEQVFNEFSSGSQDVSAIRDFARMFYNRAADSTQLPKYMLLVGRGSYNLKSASNNTNYVPAYESLNSYSPTTSYPSDDFYGMLDTNEGNWDFTPDVLDLAVGRLPVKTLSEATSTVNKIIKYTSVPGTIETGNSCSADVCSGLGDWINVVTFIADDEDGSDHVTQAENHATKVDTTYNNYNIDKIYFDAYQQVATPGGDRYPDATAAFNRRMDRGTLIVNYTGHGGELGWAHERFLEIHDINSWKNKCKLPLFFTATCEFSRWDNPGLTSAGELTLLNPDGGSIGLMSTTRVVYSGPNFTLNSYFYNHTFVPMPDGSMPRLGDLHLLTKNNMAPSGLNQRNFSLLGDPALRLNYPEYSVATTNINGTAVSPASPDTARALSTVTVQGEIHDKSGNLLPNFNGIIFPTVYDKAEKITTLSNDGTALSPPKTFLLQKNILFKGKASVTNGLFSFSFVVPKDIAYNFGKGRISYYSHDGYQDASGNFEDFIIGGTDTTAAKDVTGPAVKVYMNDDKFIFGGITNTEPKIYAVVSDSNGINTAGTSIGHDITAVLDGNITQPIILNDYYESDMDNFRTGTIRYPLTGISEGTHSLNVKVWDVYNNSSTSNTQFVVASSAGVALKHVLNYPNPFTTKTSFYFEHNKCCTTMDVQIQIFTVSGKLVKTLQQAVNLEGYRSDPIDWDGRDDYGDKIGRGVYIYRLKVKTVADETAEEFQKLVILK